MGRLEGKVAIVTGGASGIGKATSELFVQEGAKVVIADILDTEGERLASELGSSACYAHTDVSDEAQIKAMIDQAISAFGRLDCLFNNAGMAGETGSIREFTVDGFRATMDVLLMGVMLGMKHAAPIMVAQKSGSIINTSSIAGVGTGYGPHIYSAAKAAVKHVSKTVAMELGPFNVRVNAICPGGIATPIFARGLGLPSQMAEQSAEAVKKGLENWQPIPRAGLPRDIAEAALYLASDGASFVTGHALVVDGGATCGEAYPDLEAETPTSGVFGGIVESLTDFIGDAGQTGE